ncbi:MAG: DoxX family membrane protein [Ignavibacteriales bacterium]|nr:DoxX family membrane protein [Ignavibacteriales bacterium]
MKKLLSHPYTVLVTRVFIGLLFVFSSLDKIVDPSAFAQSVANYGLLPSSFPAIIATVLPWVELLCGFAVFFGVSLRGSSLLLSAMVVIFTLAVMSALLRGLDISCGCFTQDPAAGHIGWTKVVQNTALFALTLFLYFSRTTKFTLVEYLQKSGTLQSQS